MTTTWKLIVVGTSLLLAGCDSVPGVSDLLDGGSADLVPIPEAGFCRGDSVVVSVRNRGSGDADASTTTVAFSRGGSFQLATPGIESGRIATLSPLGIPAECFAPVCVFQVTADSGSDVDETEENNNTAEVSCQPPT